MPRLWELTQAHHSLIFTDKSAVAGDVVMRDYDYLKPTLDLHAAHAVDSAGKREVQLFAENILDSGEAGRYAQVRAKAVQARAPRFASARLVAAVDLRRARWARSAPSGRGREYGGPEEYNLVPDVAAVPGPWGRAQSTRMGVPRTDATGKQMARRRTHRWQHAARGRG